MPSAEQADDGPRQGALTGDLNQAYKVLSLRLPRVVGAHSIAPAALLHSPGASGVPASPLAPAGQAANPHAAVFQALLQSLIAGRGRASAPTPPPAVLPVGPRPPAAPPVTAVPTAGRSTPALAAPAPTGGIRDFTDPRTQHQAPAPAAMAAPMPEPVAPPPPPAPALPPRITPGILAPEPAPPPAPESPIGGLDPAVLLEFLRRGGVTGEGSAPSSFGTWEDFQQSTY